MSFTQSSTRGGPTASATASKNRLLDVLSLPSVSDKCKEFDKYLNEARYDAREDYREFLEVFPSLMVHLFGLSDSENIRSSWFASSMQSAQDYDSLLKLLHPTGKFFKTIIKFVTDDITNYLYVFPAHRLPANARKILFSQSKLDLNALPSIFRNKLKSATGKTVLNELTLNIFEYYIFYFAYFGVFENVKLSMDNFSIQTSSHKSSSSKRDLYTVLFQLYLEFFLSLEKPTTSPIPLNMSSIRNTQEYPQLGQLFVQVMIEFWLNQNSRVIVGNLSREMARALLSKEFVVPTERSLLSSIKLIEYLILAFTWTSSKAPISSPRSLNTYSEMAKSMMPVTAASVANELMNELQKPLFVFLKLSFNCWLLESNTPLSHVVDLWTSFISPWTLKYSPISASKPNLPSTTHFSDAWIPYVEDNFIFFTTLANDFFTLALEFNFNTSKEDLLNVEKVVRVLNDPPLLQLLTGIEKSILSLATMQSQFVLGNSPNRFERVSQILSQSKSLAGQNFEYKPIFEGENLQVIKKLMKNLQIAQELSKQFSKPKEKGFMKSFTQMLETTQTTKSEIITTHIVEQLSKIFKLSIEPIALEDIQDNTERRYEEERKRAPETLPKSIQLTSAGREQVRRGVRKSSKLDVEYIGDIATMPLRSDENEFLVRQMYKVTKYVREHEELHQYGLHNFNFRLFASYRMHFLLICAFLILYLLLRLLLLLFF